MTGGACAGRRHSARGSPDAAGWRAWSRSPTRMPLRGGSWCAAVETRCHMQGPDDCSFDVGETVLVCNCDGGGGWWPAEVLRCDAGGDATLRWLSPEWRHATTTAPWWRICRRPREDWRRADLKGSWEPLRPCELLPWPGRWQPRLEEFLVDVASPRWRGDALWQFRRHGFVVLRGALGASECRRLLGACVAAEADLLRHSGQRGGNRGPGRWSFGVASSTSAMLHRPEWTALLQCEALLDFVDVVLPGGGKCVSAGGDFVCGGGKSTLQKLHSDLGGTDIGFAGAFPPPYISANFAVNPISATSGPMRIVPSSQRWAVDAARMQRALPDVDGDPCAWGMLALEPLLPGDVIVRDVRVLHGGTPNLGAATRFLPSLEFVLGWWAASPGYDWPDAACLPRELFERLPDHAKRWCWGLVADEPLAPRWNE